MYAHNRDKDEFERRSLEYLNLVQKLSMRHLQFLRSDFYSKAGKLIRDLTNDVHANCLTFKGAAEILQKEIQHISQQDVELVANQAKLYVIVKKEKVNNLVQIGLHQVGFVGGGSQIFGGAGICVASLGAACAGYGAPMILHGANNVYENGYYLLFRENVSGTVRDAYRYAASKLGFGQRVGDFAYGTVDIATAGYGAFRKLFKPRERAWKLWDVMYNDYVFGWEQMSKVAIGNDAINSIITGWSVYQIVDEPK